MNKIKFGSVSIDYSVERSPKRRTVSIIVDPERGIVAKSPIHVDDEQISKMVLKKAPWIQQKMGAIKRNSDVLSEKEFVSGESLQYLGRNYRLKVIRTKNVECVKLLGNRFVVEVPKGLRDGREVEHIRNLLINWYIEHARERIRERIDLYAPKLDVAPKEIVIKEQLKRWGSCTSKGVVNYNWRVILAPMSIVDYVVVHELVHLKYPNHSERYWELFASIIPNYRERRAWLKSYGSFLSF